MGEKANLADQIHDEKNDRNCKGAMVLDLSEDIFEESDANKL